MTGPDLPTPGDERRAQRQARSERLRDAATDRWTLDGVTVNVHRVEVEGDRLVVSRAEAWHNGQRLPLSLPLVYVNAPTAVRDPDGNPKDEPAEAFMRIVTDTCLRLVEAE